MITQQEKEANRQNKIRRPIMNNEEFVRTTFSQYELIIIDTSAIMDYMGLSKLVNAIELLLMEMNKKILVPKVVWMELNRHLNSKKIDKQKKACHALDIICMHPNIFSIEDDYVDYDEMMRAFADAELLSQLTRNKSQCGQLLITNDKKLSRDALDLNNLESCLGHRIEVCYISNAGLLNECNGTVKQESENESVKTDVLNGKQVEKPIQTESWFLKILIPIVTLTTGYTLGKYNRQIGKMIKSIV